MNQTTIRALSQVGELVKEEKHDPGQKFIREKDAVRSVCNAKKLEGKPYYVCMVAGCNKFLRIYYARVKEYLNSLELQP